MGEAGDHGETEVLLLTRADCHLCDQARDAVARVCQAAGAAWAERDVDADAETAYHYGDRVPVVLVRGAEHGFWRVDEPRLLAELAG